MHCQQASNGLAALKYLSPYIFRVAISNNRIVKLADSKVTLHYKTTVTGKPKNCKLAAEEFIRRFLKHVLPKSFIKLRHYGFFSPGLRPRLAAVRQHFESPLQEESGNGLMKTIRHRIKKPIWCVIIPVANLCNGKEPSHPMDAGFPDLSFPG